MLTASLAACGGGGDDDGGGGTGGSVVYALEAATAGGWCLPESQLAISGIQVARSVYDTLTVPDGEGNFQPHLAESVEPNDDFTEWTITLREGITFHDGSDLNAEVVKNNLDAARGQYEGRNSVLLAIALSDIEEVTTQGDLTVVVNTKRPWVSFDSYLYLSGRLGIIAQAQLDDPENCARNLIGTGPFAFDSWERDDTIHLSKNEDYWREDAEGNQLPYLDELEYRVIPEGQQRANALLSGQVDAFHMSSNTEAEIFDQMTGEAEGGAFNFVQSDDFAEVGLLMLNTTVAPFDNPLARQAAAYAVDREAIAEELGGGITTPASGPFAPGALGYLEDAGYPEYDEARAQDLVEQYEEETGQPLEVQISLTPQASLIRLVERTQEFLEAAGMTVTTTQLDQSALIDTAVSKDYQAITWRNYPGLDPDNLYVWWYGKAPDGTSGNLLNFMGFDSPEINELLDQGRVTGDDGERQQIYEDLNRRLSEELPMLWASWTIWGVPMSSDIDPDSIVGARPADATDDSTDYTGLALGHDPALLRRG